mmetsp:Transcript_15476/g.27147  ORF Transcript_15476/g.27147 Transcript_15476/m.27147 type:complete len:345 (-) Transcript_15476:67-1101(-)
MASPRTMPEAEVGKSASSVRDFLGGTAGGMIGILSGYPLDTAKTRLQAMTRFEKSSTWEVLRVTTQAEGIRALYKGLSFPFLCSALVTSLVFSVRGTAERRLQGSLRDRPQFRIFFAGCVAGLAASPLICTADIVKTQRQVQIPGSGSMPPGPVSIIKQRIRILGLRQACWQGLGATAMKECPSFGVYFLVYEQSKHLLASTSGLGMLSTLLSGGIAGCCALSMVHPVDVVKSRIQSLSVDATPKERSVMNVVSQGLSREGPAFFCRGFGAAMQRAFVLNSMCFGGYEFSVAVFDRVHQRTSSWGRNQVESRKRAATAVSIICGDRQVSYGSQSHGQAVACSDR